MATINPKFVIPNNRMENERQNMKEHAIIHKFFRVWPKKQDVLICVQHKWDPQGNFELWIRKKMIFYCYL